MRTLFHCVLGDPEEAHRPRQEYKRPSQEIKIPPAGVSQLDVLQAKQKKVEIEQTLAIFFHRCRNKHGPRECPLDIVWVCAICSKENAPGLKAVFKEVEEEI
jgi:hypothetical protein